MPNTVAMRIAMNFGSHAQNPFLTTLDNVKKVYLHTDGLGQNVLLKGYGSEGHDSGHLNYADIGRRIGGAEDMKILMAEGHKYGARFGIHVNVSETYPESKYFQPERLRGTPVSLPRVDDNQAPTWTPEMKVVLENDSLNKKLEITRGSNDFAGDKVGYRSRTMRMDGKVVLEETVTPTMMKDQTHVKYLLPWYWDGNGKRLTDEKEKLYAFSSKNETNVWELPEGWKETEKLYCYELTDLGRVNEREVAVAGGRISLEVTADTPYVLYKISNPEDRSVEWSEHSFVKDTGFNSRSLSHWEIKGGVEGSDSEYDLAVADTDSGTQVLKIRNNKEDVTLTQAIKGLKPNTEYALYIGVENRSDEAATIEVLDGQSVLAQNQTKCSIAFNFIQAYDHNTNSQSATVNEFNPWRRMGTSYFQNMYVFFTTPANTENLFLRIGKKAGEGTTYFDDIRFVESKGNPYSDSREGKLFKQDFENVPQGVYPFVLSGVEFVQDNRQHLSERHEPYTQRGWDTKLVSDVIEGTWSLKVNGLINRRDLLFRTIPQNYQFKPGKAYRVRFDYLAGTDEAFDFVLGKGFYYGAVDNIVFSESLKGTRYNEDVEHNQYEFEFIVPEDEEYYWIGIYSNHKQEDATGVLPKDLNFSGVKDFVLDNLEILEKETTTRDTTDRLPKIKRWMESTIISGIMTGRQERPYRTG